MVINNDGFRNSYTIEFKNALEIEDINVIDNLLDKGNQLNLYEIVILLRNYYISGNTNIIIHIMNRDISKTLISLFLSSLDLNNLKSVLKLYNEIIGYDNDIINYIIKEACRNDKLDVFEYIIANYEIDSNGCFYAACIYNNYEMVKILIKKYSDIVVDDKLLECIIDWSCKNMLKLILENFNIPNLDKFVDNIIKINNHFMLEILLKYLDYFDYEKYLLISLDNNSYNIVNLLVNNYDYDIHFIMQQFRLVFNNKQWQIVSILAERYEIQFTNDQLNFY